MTQEFGTANTKGSRKEQLKETITPLKLESLKELIYDEINKKYTLDNAILDKIKVFGKLVNH